MCDSDNTREIKNRVTCRFDKPLNCYPRNQGNFVRPPFPMIRRRAMSNRYPNRVSRSFLRPRFRPEFPVSDFRYRHPPPNRPFRPTTGHRPAFPSGLPKGNNNSNLQYTANNSDIEYSCSPVITNENQATVETSDRRSTQMIGQNMCDLWVEALAPNGQKYFYNARTRETTWDTPINTRIVEFDEMNRLASNNVLEQIQNLPSGQDSFAKSRPNIPYTNSFFPIPVNFATPPGLLMFPPPSALYNPPQIFGTNPAKAPEDTAEVKFNVVVPPPMFPFCVTSCNSVSKVNIDVKKEGTFSETNEKPAQVLSPEQFVDTKELTINEGKISDWSISNSNTSLCSSGSINEVKDVFAKMKDSVHMDNAKLRDCKLEDNIKNATKECSKSRNVSPREKAKECSKVKENGGHVDKSRPVSSTPVPGSSWCIVWTGDEKVFYYDSRRKISVWERPEELFHRLDVDKLVKKPVLLAHEKPNKSDISVKKLKMEDKNKVDLSVLDESNGASEGDKSRDGKSPSEEISHDQRTKIFREMLVEKNVSAFSTWEKEHPKIVFDSRYLLLPAKERRHVFECYILEKMDDEKRVRQKELNRLKENFRSLLKDSGVTSKTEFSDFAQRFGKDVRFSAIDKIKKKENLFNQYISEITEKERETEKRKLQQKTDFIRLLSEQGITSKNITLSELDEKILHDERYKAIQSQSAKENLLKEFIKKLDQGNSLSSDKEERVSASIRNREAEVKRDLFVHLKDREREQELHKHKLAESDFKALLNDLIDDSHMSWYSARKILKEDHRWNFSNYLESEEREKLFNEYIEELISKKEEQFRCLLDEMPNITLNTSWLDIRDGVLRDPRCSKFSSSERECEKEFKLYLRNKFLKAKADFIELLKETKLITYESKSLLNNANHLKDIEGILSIDKRYLMLESRRSDRREILLTYIDKLHTKRPLPPFTAAARSSSARSHKT